MFLPHVLVLDANILIRAVLGNKVKQLFITHSNDVDFFTPDVCIADAEKYLPVIFSKRNIPAEPALEILDKLKHLIQIVDESIYGQYALEAQKRMKKRDLCDWPVLATALTMNSAIWTEDQDFFGSGVPIWTTDRVHLFFEED